MKNFFAIAAVALITVLSSCSKDENNPAGPTAQPNQVVAKVNGQAWTGTGSGNKISIMGASTINLMGAKTNGTEVLSLVLAGVNTTGEYSFGSNTSVAQGSFTRESNGSSTTYTAVDGKINLQKLGTTAEGTFNFKAKTPDGRDSVVITDGAFNITLQ